MARKHYVGMAGIHGCMPSTCGAYDTIGQAASSLGDLHSTDDGKHGSTWVTNQLIRHHYVELSMRRHGNDYASIDVCRCDTPNDHNDD